MLNVFLSTNLKPELIDLEKFTFNSGSQFDLSGYTICDEFMKNCQDFSYFSNTKTFFFANESFCNLVNQNKLFINNRSKVLNVDKNQAMNEILQFFDDKTLLIQQKRIQDLVHKIGTFVQTSGSMWIIARTRAMAKSGGMMGLNIIKSQPLIVIAIPTVGVLFFHVCGQLAGNNKVGPTCNIIDNILNVPMGYTELLYDSYIAPIINRTIGLPIILNNIEQAQRDPSLGDTEAIKPLTDSQKGSIMKGIKYFLVKKLEGKCN